MHIHILGICGTFMGGIAAIAKSLGHHVTGSDQNVYPPMSTQLQELGIELTQGYDVSQLEPAPDIVVIGNAMSRGNPCVEYVLDKSLPYTSGPEWLKHNLLQDSWVLAVAGTHGKTTTASMLAWILEYAGLKPGFLIGGIVQNFGLSARVGQTPFFVIEADEYDTAFFDKRSKFVHYLPRTLILNNLEFDHADIFPDLDAIKRQFHHLVRTIPEQGLNITPNHDDNIKDVLNMGCWTPVEKTSINSNAHWNAQPIKPDGSQFEIVHNNQNQGTIHWTLIGDHNVFNALSAIAAARHIGIAPHDAINALESYKNVKRRMEVIGKIGSVTVYDDFAHHPTAIKMTLEGLRKQVGQEQIIAIVEPRSNTMRMGIHTETLAKSLASADLAIIYQPENLDWDLSALLKYADNIETGSSLDLIIEQLKGLAPQGGHFVLMSNGSFGGIYQKLLDNL